MNLLVISANWTSLVKPRPDRVLALHWLVTYHKLYVMLSTWLQVLVRSENSSPLDVVRITAD
jgi:hypothetical protein